MTALSPVDLRSDTVTKPTPAMRRAMAEAEVGDDVYGEDPTVNHLQKRAAEIFEKEAALFVPTGCMGNLLAIKGWAPPTSEVICEQRAHINLYELASISAIAGCLPRPTPAPDGILTWDLHRAAHSPENLLRFADRARRARKHAQHAWRHRLSAGSFRQHLRPRARREPESASRRRANFQRVGRARPQRRRTHAKIRFGDVLPLERPRRSRRFAAPRPARLHRKSAHRPKAARRRNAPDRNSRRCGIDRAGRNAENLCIATTRTPATSPKVSRKSKVSLSIRRKLSPTS